MPHSGQRLITDLRGVVLQMGVDVKRYQKNVNWNGAGVKFSSILIA